jgi:hypothetical protein
MQAAYEGYCRDWFTAVQRWNELMKTDLANLNGELAKQNLGPCRPRRSRFRRVGNGVRR